MKRDDLLAHLSSLPADADIGVQLGDAHLDITDVSAWGDGAFVALECHEADLRDVMTEWRLRVDRRQGMTSNSPDCTGTHPHPATGSVYLVCSSQLA